ncbi:hypothetical protein ACE01N_20070 [Saccharicrinis sp. FJH2]|uniref:hypothetical protein n=1 Tax=Saccharicrinis sp. FJH65 TaxID=3344659 RepID=UPI0035F25E02
MKQRMSEETKTIIKNSIELINTYCPNLFRFITKSEFSDFIRKSILFVEKNEEIEMSANFLSSMFELINELEKNASNQIRIEYGTLNYLLGEGIKRNLGSKFKHLVKGSILNFSDQSILDVMGELAACITLDKTYQFENYEYVLQNKKSIDFVFLNQSTPLLIEVLNVKINQNKYDKSNFINFLTKRIVDKHEDKTQNLPDIEKDKIYIFPILHELTESIIQEQKLNLSKFNTKLKDELNINCFLPHTFCRYVDEYYTFKHVHEI